MTKIYHQVQEKILVGYLKENPGSQFTENNANVRAVEEDNIAFAQEHRENTICVVEETEKIQQMRTTRKNINVEDKSLLQKEVNSGRSGTSTYYDVRMSKNVNVAISKQKC